MDALQQDRRPTTLCQFCGVALPMGDGPLTNCPRCAPDAERTERIIDALMEAARSCEHPADARELLAMALAWYGTLPETPELLVDLPA
ncbi:MAG TPA: hypothetical protein VKI20_03245 [Acidimicrobiales bacterium]|nr:hypothetical protein [Acidimicrobiales bacterium]